MTVQTDTSQVTSTADPSGPRTLLDIFESPEGAAATKPFLAYVDVDSADEEPLFRLTYGDLVAKADRFASLLHHRGVRRGDRVALVALPRPDYVAALVGAMKLGAVPAPINHQFKARELSATLSVLEASVVLVDDETSDMVERALDQLGTRPELIGISGCQAGTTLGDYDGTDYPRADIGPEDPALILHSSGTTGLPKTALRTHGALTEFLNMFAGYFEDDERLLNFLPLYHQAGLVLNVFAAARIGSEIVQASRFSSSGFWALVDRYEATHVNLVSPMASFILAQPPASDDREHSLRWVVVAGRNDHWADFQDRYGVTGMTFYGSTETLQITSTGNPQDGPVPRAVLESVGADNYTGPVIGDLTEFRIVDSAGLIVDEVGSPGRIEARGRYCFKEYFNQPEQTRAAFTQDGWFITGDIGYRRADGSLVLVGRESGMIRRSGENIAPREIELVLEDHPAIKEALVVGVRDEARGQEILAQVVLEPHVELSAEQVFSYLEENLSGFKVPRYLRFCEEFERTSTLKIKLNQDMSEADRASWHDRNVR